MMLFLEHFPKNTPPPPGRRLRTAERPFLHPTRARKGGSWLHFRLGRATGPCAASGRPCGYAHRPQPACCHVTQVHSGKGDSQSTTTDREANLGVSGSHLVPPGRPSSWLGHLSKISGKEWNPYQARGRSVAVDVDPNTQKKNFQKFPISIREVTPGSPSPRKPHIKVGSLANADPLSQQASSGGFGVPWAHAPSRLGCHTPKKLQPHRFPSFWGYA